MDMKTLVDRFLSCPLPETVNADAVASEPGYPHRTGTSLLTALEAEVVLEYVCGDLLASQGRYDATLDERDNRMLDMMEERDRFASALAKTVGYLISYCGEEGHCQPVIAEAKALLNPKT